jgi:K+-transporting ATPase c subunit
MVLESARDLDPHISVEGAMIQVQRVARCEDATGRGKGDG